MFEAILELLGQIFIDFFVKGICRLFIAIGSVVFSLFSLFKISPVEHYKTENFDKRVGMGWTGFGVVVLVVIAIVFLF